MPDTRNNPSKLANILASAFLYLAAPILQSYSSEPTINNPLSGTLESKIVAIDKKNQEYEIINTLKDLDKDYMSKAKIIYIPSSHLGNALSMYASGATHAIYRPVPETLPEYERQKIPIDAHESGHGLGYRDEKKTDDYASSRTGQTLRIPIIYPTKRAA